MKNISSMAALAALLLVSCGQDTDVKFAGDEGAKVTFSASINEQNSQDVSRVTGVTWDDGDEVSISCGPTQKNVFYRYNAADNSFTAINRFDEIWLLGNEEYDVTSGTYMALVKPETNYSISCTYQGTQEKMINPTGSLAGGKAKMYTIKDENNKLDYTLNIGDYLCADGNLVSVNDGTVPDNAIGVVCYVGNPEPHVTHPNNYTETNDALYRDYPNCTHGLVLALKNARNGQWDGGAFNSTSSSTRSPAYCDWLASDEEWNGLLVPCNTEANGALKNDPESMFPAFLGYNNTLVMTMCYEGKGPQNSCNNAYTYLMNYRNEVAVPSSVTPWYIPSVVCWNEVAKSSSVINKSISKLGEDKGEELVSVSSGTAKNHYWTSTQRNWATQWTHGIDGGRYTQASNKGSLAGHFRMMLAF